MSFVSAVTTEAESLVHSPGPLCPADGQLCLDLGFGCWAGKLSHRIVGLIKKRFLIQIILNPSFLLTAIE